MHRAKNQINRCQRCCPLPLPVVILCTRDYRRFNIRRANSRAVTCIFKTIAGDCERPRVSINRVHLSPAARSDSLFSFMRALQITIAFACFPSITRALLRPRVASPLIIDRLFRGLVYGDVIRRSAGSGCCFSAGCCLRKAHLLFSGNLLCR